MKLTYSIEIHTTEKFTQSAMKAILDDLKSDFESKGNGRFEWQERIFTD